MWPAFSRCLTTSQLLSNLIFYLRLWWWAERVLIFLVIKPIKFCIFTLNRLSWAIYCGPWTSHNQNDKIGWLARPGPSLTAGAKAKSDWKWDIRDNCLKENWGTVCRRENGRSWQLHMRPWSPGLRKDSNGRYFPGSQPLAHTTLDALAPFFLAKHVFPHQHL